MNRASLDKHNDAALARAEAAWLEPPDDPPAAATCPRCGEDLYEGDYKYLSAIDGEYICEACFTEEARDNREEVKEPEPDWDSMPGGADYCDW